MPVHRTCTAVLGAVAAAAALGLSGCGGGHPAAESAGPATMLTAAPTAPLPTASVLTDVLYRLADPDVTAADKVALVENATPGDAEALNRFGQALLAAGYLPLTFEAADLAWSHNVSGDVVATISVTTANERAGAFSFPMEFTPTAGSTWLLTRQTADLLLELGQTPTGPAP
jgi:hypothetical protein